MPEVLSKPDDADNTEFSRCSGFRIGNIPEELKVLNRMETRLIGLGVSFTTCVNLYKDGQEFTRGNAINYWNDPAETVRELPRPLKDCGVVFLTSSSEGATTYSHVRPDLIRRALQWLICNNPLYKDIRISEENLEELGQLNVEQELPSISLTNDEIEELRGNNRPAFNREDDPTSTANDATSASSEGTQPTARSIVPTVDIESSNDTAREQYAGGVELHCDGRRPTRSDINDDIMQDIASKEHSELNTQRTQSTSCTVCPSENDELSDSLQSTESAARADSNTIAVKLDVLANLTESFELESDQNTKQTELQHIMNAVGIDPSNSHLPVGQLRRLDSPMDEYRLKQLMQCCFPSLFPDGKGGHHPLEEHENRVHEYTLSEYVYHLMKWHDRRFVIHGNFKFFCMNLIQRRQIDGLSRRIIATESSSAAVEAAGCGKCSNDGNEQRNTNAEQQELNAAMKVLDSLKPYFRVVRGSGLYWTNVRDDLMAMIGNRSLPSRWPTFFLTLSAADTIWPDFARACNPALTLGDCQKLTFQERRKYLNENPDISAKHFNKRFKAFFDSILCGKAKPLGKIIDHFWRVEFQQRGPPHIHCLLWIKDAPDVLKLSETEQGRVELAAFIDKHITVLTKTLETLDKCPCETCKDFRSKEIDVLALRPPTVDDKEWNCDLARLVHRVQQHECHGNSSCRKKSAECRFGFPKALQKKTIVESNVSSDGTPSLKVHLKRDVSTINNYSPHLLSCWRANMDLQLIGNSYGAAEYAGAYVIKAEPDTLRFRRVITKAIQRCDRNLPYSSILKRVANATLSVREVGAPEAIYVLLRDLPMHSKSRPIQKVKIMRHHLRYYRVEPHSIEELVEQVNESIRIEPIERAYMNRPALDMFESMSLATSIEQYEPVDSIRKQCQISEIWKRVDGDGWIKRRSKAIVIQKSPWMKPDSSNPNFCFSELFLYVSWRSLDNLPSTDEEYNSRFYDEQQLQLEGELLAESNAKLLRQHKLDLLRTSRQSCSVASLPPSEYVFVDGPNNQGNQDISTTHIDSKSTHGAHSELKPRHSYTPEIVSRARNFVNEYLKPWMKDKKDLRKLGQMLKRHDPESSRYLYPISDCQTNLQIEETMAESQRIPFSLAMQQSRKRFKGLLEMSSCKPLQMIISGEGESGKSWLIRHIVKDTHNVFGEHAPTRRTSKRVLLLAHQGMAAFNIKGTTICSALSFSSFSNTAFSVPYKSLTETKSGPSKLKSMQELYKGVHLVIIDEFSTVSCGMLIGSIDGCAKFGQIIRMSCSEAETFTSQEMQLNWILLSRTLYQHQ